jgi:hypothetical protein
MENIRVSMQAALPRLARAESTKISPRMFGEGAGCGNQDF